MCEKAKIPISSSFKAFGKEHLYTDDGGVVDAVCVLVDRSGGKVTFDVPVVSLLQWEPVTWQPAECPLCQKGVPVSHPGST